MRKESGTLVMWSFKLLSREDCFFAKTDKVDSTGQNQPQ